ncbi:efflux RND transporter periplasmic adaptor subunit [Segnochrobactrum spirostomi]
MIKRLVIMLVVVGAAAYGLYWFQNFKAGMIQQAISGMANPAQIVAAQPAKMRSWQPKIDLVGELRASDGADLSLQVSGIVQTINFQSGDEVPAGKTLLQLNADDQVAKLESLKATAELDAINLKRDQQQLKINAVAQATVDTDQANLKNAEALVAQQQALVEQYRLTAPFAGRLGIRAVDLGQYLSAGTTIVTLQALDPIFSDFYVPQKSVDQLKIGQEVRLKVDTFPGETFLGEISAISPKVESGSRNAKVRATFKNPDKRLLPGMFVSLSIEVGKPEQYVSLPQTAIVANSYGNTVFIVDKDKNGEGEVARQTFVKTGQTEGDLIAVLDGVKEGEMVVTVGQIKLRNGSPVKIDNSHVPIAEANPVVADQ